ncbi:hypothetical protein EUGRSUZ_F03026 [Eucalyptus grandis]|uniref:OVATE domain-containing protein n=2 Tax=Eucalyptus grandis TaxID=71139 RepID=A0A059BU14_EUCGR|nr:hypothetical protein EUGRSUZ_F03026 [Eucalyptus grandis]
MEKSPMRPDHAGSFMRFGNHGPGNRRWEREGKVEKPVASHPAKSEGHSSPGDEDGGFLVLAQKMKELELMDLGDVEHLLDLEEALHYYSHLTSPVFLDIVHKFFMEIYSEFSTVREPIRTNNSKRRSRSMEF